LSGEGGWGVFTGKKGWRVRRKGSREGAMEVHVGKNKWSWSEDGDNRVECGGGGSKKRVERGERGEEGEGGAPGREDGETKVDGTRGPEPPLNGRGREEGTAVGAGGGE